MLVRKTGWEASAKREGTDKEGRNGNGSMCGMSGAVYAGSRLSGRIPDTRLEM